MASEHFFRPAAAICAWICGVVLLGLLLAGSAAAQTVTYIHTDALGSVVAETDANGNVIKRYDYEPYRAVVGGEVTDGPGYTGHVSDSATGLSYMQQRYMDPQLGVFLSVDPVTAYEQPVGQFNRYRYANGNPYKFTDPDGRSATCGERSCVIECASGFACAVDYVYVGTVYGGRLLRNAVESILPAMQQSQSPEGDAPALPGGLVGTEDKGSRQQGGRVNNGPLAPDNGGVGDGLKDFGTLTGGKFGPAPEGSRLPEGAQVGENGVIYRPGNAGSGPRIDVPANGEKPHETLHYPKPPPPPERSGP